MKLPSIEVRKSYSRASQVKVAGRTYNWERVLAYDVSAQQITRAHFGHHKNPPAGHHPIWDQLSDAIRDMMVTAPLQE